MIDADEFDDGLLSLNPISVRVNNWDITGDIFLNVLIDRNDDGDWTDPGEWAVQNAVTGTPIFRGASFETTESWDPVTEGALRLTVTTQAITNYDGTGTFALGETEDYLAPPEGELIVSVAGGGNVTSDVGGIDCPDTECSTSLVGGSTVTLTATPEPNREFLGWDFGERFFGSECADRGNNPTCSLAIDSNSLKFARAVFTENVQRAFSLAPGSPTLVANGWSPADILLLDEDAGVVTRLFTAAELGLSPADDINALGFFSPGQPSVVSTEFSVSEGSAGALGTQIETEAAFAGDLGADVWALAGLGGFELEAAAIGAIDPFQPFQWVDEDGINAGSNHPIAAAGLLIGDEIDGWSRVDPADPGTPYYSLAPGSPTLTSLSASSADILESEAGVALIGVSHVNLGLDAADDVDALSGNVGVGGGETIHVSLSPGSPSLAANGWNPTFVLTSFNFGGGFNSLFVDLTEFDLGLLDTDNLDALELAGFGGQPS